MEHPPTSRPRDEQPDRAHDQGPRPSDHLEVPIDGTPLEKVSAFLRIAFVEADARGEAITAEDAHVVASLLAQLLGPASDMARFAETSDAHPAQLHEECQHIRGRAWQTPDVDLWVERFEQYLAAQTNLGRQAGPVSTEVASFSGPQTEEGVREHGDIDPDRADLLRSFRDVYIGTYASMDALLDELTEVGECLTAINEVAKRWGFDGLANLDREAVMHIAHETWDIVQREGRFHVFSK
jgi:hypothetical protein